MTSQPTHSIRRYLPLTLALGAASLGCLLMIALRMLFTGSVRYRFLLWNLFLAWIPYGLAMLLCWISTRGGVARRMKPLTVVLGLAWLFFYPNAPYILTDFIHVVLNPPQGDPFPPLITENALLWYDIILNSSFAFIGHMIGLISLLVLHRTIDARAGSLRGWGFAVAAIALGGYGIYIGRFERLNSWEVLSDPLDTLRVMVFNLFNLKALLFSLCFAFFIFLTYLVVHSLYQAARRE
jgi:uncharacterized membrane protein